MKRHRKRRANRRHKKMKKFIRAIKVFSEALNALSEAMQKFPIGGITPTLQVDGGEYIVPPNTIQKICNQQ